MFLLFLVSMSILFYLYVWYIIIIWILAKLQSNKILLDDSYEPIITVMVPVKNEEFTIEEKINNIFLCDYPKDKLHVLIMDSTSDDDTQKIVSKYISDWVQLEVVPHKGKAFAMQVWIDQYAKWEIIISTDANAYFKKDTLRKIVRNYADPSVWWVTGAMLQIDKSGTVESKWWDLYWRIEKFIRICETKFHSVITMSWELTSFRKELVKNKKWYFKWDPDDFDLSMFVVRQWYRLIYETEAFVYEKAPDTASDVEKQKVRIIVQTMSAFTHYFSMLFKWKYGFILFSHKLLPLLSPILLIILFISNIFLLSYLIFQIILVVQVVFYTAYCR